MGEIHMWEQLTPHDIARANQKLTLTRAATLARHAAELKSLDTQQEEIDNFAHLMSRFAEKYLTADKSVFQPTGSDEQHLTEAHANEEPSTEAHANEEPSTEAHADEEQSTEAHANEEQSTQVREIEEQLILSRDGFAAVEASESAASEGPRDKPSDLRVQHMSPNFGIPLRRFVRR
jgi:hypothetical protein